MGRSSFHWLVSSVLLAVVLAIIMTLEGCGSSGSSGTADFYYESTDEAIASGGASLSGILKDITTSSPVSGASCTLTLNRKLFLRDFMKAAATAYTATTDSGGGYTFTGLSPGTYTLQFSRDGYVTTVVRGIEISTSDVVLNRTVTRVSQWAQLTGDTCPFDSEKGYAIITATASIKALRQAGITAQISPSDGVVMGYIYTTGGGIPIVDWTATGTYDSGQIFFGYLKPGVQYTVTLTSPGNPPQTVAITSETGVLSAYGVTITAPTASPSPNPSENPSPAPSPTVTTSPDQGGGSGGGSAPQPSPSASPSPTPYTGKIIIGGNFTATSAPTEKSLNYIGRVNYDGTLDTGFFTGSGFNGKVKDMVRQSNGRIYVMGNFTSYNGTSCKNIVRLNTNGSLDTSFNIDQTFSVDDTAYPYPIALSSGNILLAGTANAKYKDHNCQCGMVQIDSSGNYKNQFCPRDEDIDAGYGYDINIGFSGYFTTGAVDSNNNVILAGLFTLQIKDNAGTVLSTRNNIMRFTDEGLPDLSFGDVGTLIQNPGSINILEDGKILVWDKNGSRLIRLKSDGSSDSVVEFNPDGSDADKFLITKTTGRPAIQSDGKIIITTDTSTQYYNNKIYYETYGLERLYDNGTIDTYFDTATCLGPAAGFINAYCPLVQSDGKTVFASYSLSTSHHGFLRCDSTGACDPDFVGLDNGIEGFIGAAVLQSDDKVVFGGDFTGSEIQTTRHSIAQLKDDGTIDTSFPDSANGNEVCAIHAENDGSLIVGGNFTQVWDASAGKYVPTNYMVYLNADGSVAGTLSGTDGPNGKVTAIVSQPDGKLLIGGAFDQFDSFTHKRLARICKDGSIDAAFNPGFDGDVLAILQLGDDLFLAGGAFSNFWDYLKQKNVPRNYIAGFSGNGQTGDSEEGGPLNGRVSCIVSLPDDELLLGGAFDFTDQGREYQRILKLKGDDSFDSEFKARFNGEVLTIVPTGDGGYLVGGNFTKYCQKGQDFDEDGIVCRYFAIIEADGSLGWYYQAGGPDNKITSIVILPDKTILLGGAFTSFNGDTSIQGIARINDTGAPVKDFINNRIDGTVNCIRIK